MTWDFKLYLGLDAIGKGLPAAQWLDVFRRSMTATAFQHPAVVRAWYAAYSETRRTVPAVLHGHGSGREAVMALEQLPRGQRLLLPVVAEAAGGESQMDFKDPLVTGCGMSEDELAEFWRDVKRSIRSQGCRWDKVVLNRLRPEWTVGLVDGVAAAGASPELDLAGKKDLDEILASCSSSHRGDVRRQMRRLAKEGAVESVRVEPGSAHADEKLDCFLRLYEARWATNRAEADAHRSFLSTIMRDPTAAGLVHLSCLTCGGRAIHWHFGFVHAGRFYWYKMAYDPTWAWVGPGKVHLGLLIDECVRSGFLWFDFLYGDEPYKFEWGAAETALHRMEWWNGRRPLLRLANSVLRPACRALRKAGRVGAQPGAAPQ